MALTGTFIGMVLALQGYTILVDFGAEQALGQMVALSLLRETYRHDPCIVVTDEPPTLKDPLGSNVCFVSAAVDERTGTLLAMSSLDNLVKGAAGQALQCLNVAAGFEETTGLPLVGVTP